MGFMFSNAISFNQNLGAWDTSKCVAMDNMFQFADVFNGNISSWDVSANTDMWAMVSCNKEMKTNSHLVLQQNSHIDNDIFLQFTV